MGLAARLVWMSPLVWALLTAPLPGGGPASGAPAPGSCPPGSTPVEDVATGKVICERADSLDTRDLPARRAGPPAPPGAPGRPGEPGAPREPEEPKKAPSLSASDCGVSRWGCEQACQQTYLSAAVKPDSDAAQRAKVALGACLRICAREFECEAREPAVPLK